MVIGSAGIGVRRVYIEAQTADGRISRSPKSIAVSILGLLFSIGCVLGMVLRDSQLIPKESLQLFFNPLVLKPRDSGREKDMAVSLKAVS
jgi:hypothetical protein